MAIAEGATRRVSERPMFLFTAILFPLLVLVGFARSFYLKPIAGGPPLPSMLVHLHGLVMTAWVALFITQIWLVRRNNVQLHQKLGVWGIFLATALVVLGFFTTLSAGKNGSASFPKDIPQLSFMIVPIFDLLAFIGLFAAAMYYRKRSSANHKRLMLLTAINFLPPALSRFPVASVAAAGPALFLGVPVLLTITALVWDTRRNGKLNRVFLVAATLYVISIPLRFGISGTAGWMKFGRWLTGFALV
jgi:uncharacterized membrane protein YozB (DUF420 family)